MNEIENLPYRLGVGMMLINADKEIFVGKRIDTKSEAWQMPQGGIDKGEEAEEAVIRELEEEVGTYKANIIAISDEWHCYDLPKKLVPRVWGGKYRGQKQKWFLLEFTGEESDINIHTKHPEFCQWQWVAADKLPEIIVPFKKKIYTDILNEFKHLL